MKVKEKHENAFVCTHTLTHAVGAPGRPSPHLINHPHRTVGAGAKTKRTVEVLRLVLQLLQVRARAGVRALVAARCDCVQRGRCHASGCCGGVESVSIRPVQGGTCAAAAHAVHRKWNASLPTRPSLTRI